MTTLGLLWTLGLMSVTGVVAFVEAGQLEEAVELLQNLPVESVPLERIRRWTFHAHADLRQLVVTLLGQGGDIESAFDLARLFEADLDFYDHDFIFEAYVRMGEAAIPGLVELFSSTSTLEKEGRNRAWQGVLYDIVV